MCKRESSNHKCDCVFVQSIHIDPDEDGRVECFSPGAVYQGVNSMIKSPSTVAQLSDSESRKNLSVSNGWMTRTRLPELCHTAFDCHR